MCIEVAQKRVLLCKHASHPGVDAILVCGNLAHGDGAHVDMQRPRPLGAPVQQEIAEARPNSPFVGQVAVTWQ